MSSKISIQDKQELVVAKQLLENPGIAAKLTNFLGTPIEKGFEVLPENWKHKISVITQKSLLKATETAILTMKNTPSKTPSNKWHKLSVATSGGIGGFFGFTALAIELPVSTTIMLRSIIDIARSQGEDVDTYETKLACLEVFALGGKTTLDDATESGYFTMRTLLAKSISESMQHLGSKTASKETAPALLKLISSISQRFGIQISEKAAAQAIPILGAAGGALINTIFIDHFQDMAKGHFIVRKLEKKYNQQQVKALYEQL
ncbi:EcsC family protein [Lutibacter holmesii]|uniref:EcsC family protein n=1 Tax=Lutibacter holmesii TaxID=1137985 RepID=A0ABW3WP31_9FLAO